MFKLIKNGSIINDEWKTIRLAEGESANNVKLPVGPLLVPLSVWRARRVELIHREYEHGWPLGIWLSEAEDAESIAHDLDDFTVIAIAFDRYSDGNSYSIARVLREKFGYSGELRAIGDVPRDRLAFQHQVGFDSFALRTDYKHGNVLSGLFLHEAVQRKPQHQGIAA